MSRSDAGRPAPTGADADRRTMVLESAMATFARFGYRKTSMEEVARAAHISRPGLYFLFSSKESLFRAAVTQALHRDITAVERALADGDRPLPERLVEAFDHWAGRYVGPLTRDVATVIEANPGILGAEGEGVAGADDAGDAAVQEAGGGGLAALQGEHGPFHVGVGQGAVGGLCGLAGGRQLPPGRDVVGGAEDETDPLVAQ